jgi:nicotinate-nucleotide adenylyltransferase
MNILILGSAFDPPHKGHADTVYQNLDKFDKILLVPSYAHGFGKKMRPFEHRFELTLAFCEQFNNENSKVEASDVERDIYNMQKEKGPVYTYVLLCWLQKKYGPDVEFSFLMGPDNEDNFHKFYKHEEIRQNWGLVVAKERVNVRSSLIRPLITEDKANITEIESMTGKAVSEKIFENIDLWVQ